MTEDARVDRRDNGKRKRASEQERVRRVHGGAKEVSSPLSLSLSPLPVWPMAGRDTRGRSATRIDPDCAAGRLCSTLRDSSTSARGTYIPGSPHPSSGRARSPAALSLSLSLRLSRSSLSSALPSLSLALSLLFLSYLRLHFSQPRREGDGEGAG